MEATPQDFNGDGLLDIFLKEDRSLCLDTTCIKAIIDVPTFKNGNTQAGAARIAAEAARIAAENTVAYAQQAASNAQNAYSAANAANNNATTAANNTAYGGGSAAYWGYYGYYRANDAANNAQNAVNSANNATNAANSANNTITTSRTDILNSINNSTTQITNTVKATIRPDIKKVSGQNGATCAKSGAFTVVVSATDADEYRAYVDGVGGAWQTNPSIILSITPGVHTIYVQARNSRDTSKVVQDTMTVFGL